jgi:hypothetical protein
MLPHHCFKTTAAAALALSAIAAPAAAAHPLPPDPVYHPPKPGPTIVRVSTPTSRGFDWGDAGIGAAGGLALATLGIGGGLAIAQGRERRSGTSAAVAGPISTPTETRSAGAS